MRPQVELEFLFSGRGVVAVAALEWPHLLVHLLHVAPQPPLRVELLLACWTLYRLCAFLVHHAML